MRAWCSLPGGTCCILSLWTSMAVAISSCMPSTLRAEVKQMGT